MARIRTIKPHFFTDEHLSALPAETQLLAAGLLCYADDEGYFNANPKLVEAAVFPTRELSLSTHGMLSELCGVGYIELTDGPDGRKYGRIISFASHQRINRPTPSAINKLQLSWSTHPQLSESSPQNNVGIRNKEGNKEGEMSEPSKAQLSLREKSNAIVREAAIPSSEVLEMIVGKSILAYATDQKISEDESANFILSRVQEYRSTGKRVTRFWFENGGYLPDLKPPAKPEYSVVDEMKRQLGIAK